LVQAFADSEWLTAKGTPDADPEEVLRLRLLQEAMAIRLNDIERIRYSVGPDGLTPEEREETDNDG